MKLHLLLVILLSLLFCKSGLAQTKEATIQWLNDSGEEYLKDVTGNSSIYWELDNNGTLRITNRKGASKGAREIIKSYTYLNLYQLSSEKSLFSEDTLSKQSLVLRCKPKAHDCIKNRNYYTDSNFSVNAASSIKFDLQKSFDVQKVKKLERELIRAIRFINGKKVTPDSVR